MVRINTSSKAFGVLACVLLFLPLMALFCQDLDYGDFPRERIPPEGWQKVVWKDPGNWKLIDVSEHGLFPNDSTLDAAIQIEEIIRKGSGNRIIYLPEGTYSFTSTCDITTGGIIFRGAGKDLTTINIDCRADGFLFHGSYDAPELNISGSVARGDSQITVKETSGLEEGDFIRIYNPGVISLYLGKTEGKRGEFGQIVRITKKRGNTLDLDMKMGIEIPEKESPRAKKADMISDVGVEDLKVYRVSLGPEDKGQIRNIMFQNVSNGFVRRIESDHTYGWHIGLEACRDVLISENFIHDGWVGGGGKAYGINFRMCTTRCMAFNNTLERCRHHISFGRGSNHCIYAYNHCDGRLSHDNYVLFHGNYNNHNLVEGNWASGNIVIDGWHREEGINNCFFRNFTTARVGDHAVNFKSPRTTIVANECKEITYPAGLDCFVGANRVDGSMEWGSLDKNSKIPASLFLDSAPAFLEKWPLFGPETNMNDK